MTIVFLSPSGELGGAETALLDLMAAVRLARPSWTLSLVASAPGPLHERASTLGISSISLPFPDSLARLGEWANRRSRLGGLSFAACAARASVPSMRYGGMLKRHLHELRPDVVHTNGVKMHLLGALCRPSGARVVWHLHDYPGARPLTALALGAVAGRCSVAIANSESVAVQARGLFGARVSVCAIHNAVDLDRFQPEGHRLDLDALAALPPLPSGAIRIGLVATFARWKGHDVFLKALRQVRSAAHVRGYVIGAPIYRTTGSQFSVAELRALAHAEGLNNTSVGFVGHVDDVPGALRALDIVVHASIEPEPFGLAIAEAMACGRPVVVSDAGGAAEIATGGAMFHRPGDARDLASRLSELINHPELRATLAAAARQAALRLFGRQRLAEAVTPIYEAV